MNYESNYNNYKNNSYNNNNNNNFNNNNNNNNNKYLNNSMIDQQKVQKEYFLKSLGKQRIMITVFLERFTTTTSSEFLSSIGEFYFVMENIRTPSNGELNLVNYLNKNRTLKKPKYGNQVHHYNLEQSYMRVKKQRTQLIFMLKKQTHLKMTCY
jgi:hypothetical protein